MIHFFNISVSKKKKLIKKYIYLSFLGNVFLSIKKICYFSGMKIGCLLGRPQTFTSVKQFSAKIFPFFAFFKVDLCSNFVENYCAWPIFYIWIHKCVLI